ncbi:hypothetical protein [Nocardia sp. NPDC049149]|uniref:hypothetical protein n=1 Tax=Nocardia sp. NPDC049149 TaxID=3364315 RepID=UPI0037211595
MEAFEADPLGIRHASQVTKDISTRVQQVITTLQGVVAATDGGWGNDDYGAEFHKGYGPARDSLSKVTTSVQQHLGQVAADEITAAELAEATEQRSAQNFGTPT